MSAVRFFGSFAKKILTTAGVLALAICAHAEPTTKASDTWDIMKLNSNFMLRFGDTIQTRKEQMAFDSSEARNSFHPDLTNYEKYIIPMSKDVAQGLSQKELHFSSGHCFGRIFVPMQISSYQVDQVMNWQLLRAISNGDAFAQLTRFDLVLIEKEFLHMQIICKGNFQEAGHFMTNELGFDWQILERHEPEWLAKFYQEHQAAKAIRNQAKKKTDSDKANQNAEQNYFLQKARRIYNSLSGK